MTWHDRTRERRPRGARRASADQHEQRRRVLCRAARAQAPRTRALKVAAPQSIEVPRLHASVQVELVMRLTGLEGGKGARVDKLAMDVDDHARNGRNVTWSGSHAR